MFPWIPFLFGVRKTLSDIEYLAIKEFDGKLVKNEGVKSTTGTLATLTASSGKDMYLGRAKLVARENSSGGTVKVELQANSVVLETALLAITNGQSVEYDFKNVGHKVVATQVIKLEITALSATDVEGFVECFEETTGDSPQV